MFINRLVQAAILSASVIGVSSEIPSFKFERFRCTGGIFTTYGNKCYGNGIIVYESTDIKKVGIPIRPESSVGYYFGVHAPTPKFENDIKVKCVSGCVLVNDDEEKAKQDPFQYELQKTLATSSQIRGPTSSNNQVTNLLQGQPQISRRDRQEISLIAQKGFGANYPVYTIVNDNLSRPQGQPILQPSKWLPRAPRPKNSTRPVRPRGRH